VDTPNVIATQERRRLAGGWERVALVGRVASGSVFVGFGLAKFVNHADEAASFQSYGLPVPDAFVYLIGAVEVVGGLLLLAGLATRAVAAILAADMIGAIAVSGAGEGEIISLTLAPALLVLMLLLIVVGPGALAPDRRLSGKRLRH
jgi:putative oxidoreductase